MDNEQLVEILAEILERLGKLERGPSPSLVEHVVSYTPTEEGTYEVVINHPVLKEQIEFHATPYDPDPAGQELFEALNNNSQILKLNVIEKTEPDVKETPDEKVGAK